MIAESFFLNQVNLHQIHDTPTYLGYCGQWQLKLLTSTFVDETKKAVPLHEFSGDYLSARAWLMLPRTFVKKATEHWLKATSWRLRWPTTQVLSSLKEQLITSQKPVVIVVGHGYCGNERVSNSLRKNIFLQHYVSIRWYDDEWVYIYDSTFPENNKLPVGNLFVPYASFLYYRSRGYCKLHSYNTILFY